MKVDTHSTVTDNQLDNMFGLLELGKETEVVFEKVVHIDQLVRYSNRAGLHKLKAIYNYETQDLTVRLPDRLLLNKYYNNEVELNDGHNRMGCSENWYDPFYAISQTFSADSVDKMSDKELDNLLNLASTIMEALY